MDLAEVKSFLKVDFDDDDTLIELEIKAAEEYIKDAIGSCNMESARVKLLILHIVTTLYENRLYAVSNASGKVQYTLRSMVLQLQLGD